MQGGDRVQMGGVVADRTYRMLAQWNRGELRPAGLRRSLGRVPLLGHVRDV